MANLGENLIISSVFFKKTFSSRSETELQDEEYPINLEDVIRMLSAKVGHRMLLALIKTNIISERNFCYKRIQTK